MRARTSFITRLMRYALPAIALICTSGFTLAQDQPGQNSMSRVITKAQLNKTECTCRLFGQNLPVGSEICMRDSMFRCQMDQNVTSWRPLASPCPQS
ncbi:MAG: hypothetical protein J0L51_08720 [Rhizobiales bacterium]|nr:hypothetical protein [Hyphomicrobiales bacterium]